ncbi:MAG: transposase [Actinomycetia bacterium]|nr:transposase [Actinomycetes bacterium]
MWILCEVDAADAGGRVAQVCQGLGVPEKAHCRWKGLHSGMKTTELQRLKELEADRPRLKKLVASLTLGNAMADRPLGGKPPKPGLSQPSCRSRGKRVRGLGNAENIAPRPRANRRNDMHSV